jgi:acyl-coenzyme A thioesterase 9
MHDSYCEVTLPFKSSPEFLEQYTNASGGIRTGKIMEVLDSTAGSVAYKHLLGPEAETVGTIQEQGFYVVTASVDR